VLSDNDVSTLAKSSMRHWSTWRSYCLPLGKFGIGQGRTRFDQRSSTNARHASSAHSSTASNQPPVSMSHPARSKRARSIAASPIAVPVSNMMPSIVRGVS